MSDPAAEERLIESLRDLIRIPSVNPPDPPGPELAAAHYLRDAKLEHWTKFSRTAIRAMSYARDSNQAGPGCQPGRRDVRGLPKCSSATQERR